MNANSTLVPSSENSNLSSSDESPRSVPTLSLVSNETVKPSKAELFAAYDLAADARRKAQKALDDALIAQEDATKAIYEAYGAGPHPRRAGGPMTAIRKENKKSATVSYFMRGVQDSTEEPV
jgi:hypothetical protein